MEQGLMIKRRENWKKVPNFLYIEVRIRERGRRNQPKTKNNNNVYIFVKTTSYRHKMSAL